MVLLWSICSRNPRWDSVAANHCGSKERGVKRGVFEVGARKEGFKISLYVVRRRRRRRAESALTASYRHTLAYRLKINVLLLRFHFSNQTYVCMYVESGPFGRAGDRCQVLPQGRGEQGAFWKKQKWWKKSSLRLISVTAYAENERFCLPVCVFFFSPLCQALALGPGRFATGNMLHWGIW